MKWIAQTTQPKQLKLEIVEELLKSLTPKEPDTYAYHLYVWETGEGIEDQLQDTLESAIEQAEEDFGVPKDAWKKVE